MSLAWCPKITYSDEVVIDFSLPQKFWEPEEGVGIGDEDEAASGVPIAYVQRYDYAVAVTLRFTDSERIAVMQFVEWAFRNKGTPFDFQFDGPRATTIYSVYMETPKSGTRVRPVRDAQDPSVWTLPLVLRSADSTRIHVEFDFEGEIAGAHPRPHAALFVQDTFNDGGDVGLTTRDGELGAHWHYNDDESNTVGLVDDSGVLEVNEINKHFLAMPSGTAPTKNGFVKAHNVVVDIDVEGTCELHIAFRAKDDWTDPGYFLKVIPTVSGGGTVVSILFQLGSNGIDVVEYVWFPPISDMQIATFDVELQVNNGLLLAILNTTVILATLEENSVPTDQRNVTLFMSDSVEGAGLSIDEFTAGSLA